MSEVKKTRTLEEMEADMIKVTDEYLIDIDPYNYIARRKGSPKVIGYFGNLKNALTCIYEDMCKRKLKNEAKSLPDVSRIVVECKNEISDAINKAFPEYEVVKR